MRTGRGQRLLEDKLRPLGSVLKKLDILKRQGKQIVFTNGCFDLMHFGHARYLQDARSKGDILVVGVNSDSSVRRIKGSKRPIVDEQNRLKLVACLESVDFALLFGEDTPLNLIRKIRPDILVKGADWSKDRIVGAEFVRGYGGKVLTVKLVKGLSTTNLIDKIAKKT